MDFSSLILLSLGLAMDACAVSIANGLCYSCNYNNTALKCAFSFGLAQALMPLAGYFLGGVFSQQIKFLDHWIALILLSIIGGKMLCEGIKSLKEFTVVTSTSKKPPLTSKTIFAQSIATSIDAFTIGISFALMEVNIFYAISLIGTITFIVCYIAIKLATKLSPTSREKAQITGGIILVMLGIRIFIEHTT